MMMMMIVSVDQSGIFRKGSTIQYLHNICNDLNCPIQANKKEKYDRWVHFVLAHSTRIAVTED